MFGQGERRSEPGLTRALFVSIAVFIAALAGGALAVQAQLPVWGLAVEAVLVPFAVLVGAWLATGRLAPFRTLGAIAWGAASVLVAGFLITLPKQFWPYGQYAYAGAIATLLLAVAASSLSLFFGQPGTTARALTRLRRRVIGVAGLLLTTVGVGALVWLFKAPADLYTSDYVWGQVAVYMVVALAFPPGAALGFALLTRLAGRIERAAERAEQARPADGVGFERKGSGAVHR